MITDNINNASKYYANHRLFEIAFKYLISTNFENLPEGKYPIKGEDCFAIVNRYNTKKIEESFAESHRKYIDIQFVVMGNEKIGYGYINDFEPCEYDSLNDLQKHIGELSFISLKKDSFAIFFPDDVHMPGIIDYEQNTVLKVVVKIAY